MGKISSLLFTREDIHSGKILLTRAEIEKTTPDDFETIKANLRSWGWEVVIDDDGDAEAIRIQESVANNGVKTSPANTPQGLLSHHAEMERLKERIHWLEKRVNDANGEITSYQEQLDTCASNLALVRQWFSEAKAEAAEAKAELQRFQQSTPSDSGSTTAKGMAGALTLIQLVSDQHKLIAEQHGIIMNLQASIQATRLEEASFDPDGRF